ncbi:MAG: EamA family transporter RarD, partial [Syntrophobacteraceae bacterium]
MPGRSGESASGFLYTAAAFLIWGLSPVYWKQLASVPSLEIIMHRVVWSPLILLPVLFRQHRTDELVSSLKTTRTLLNLLVTTVLVSGNWLIFIWAINNGYVLQTSIGYYITPLINVLLGMVFLKERLRPLQIAALVLAAAAVLYLTVDYGSVPWIALALGFSFGLYGMLHKVMPVTPI